jgi:RHS repeat-associated protein
LPYGEQWVDVSYQNPAFATTYKFSGKEKDEETGFGYFGARYYYDYLSIWLSTDPLADKYPNTSPYVYCNNNPVILMDPDGMEWVDCNGQKIDEKQQKNIKAYIFYDPKSFGKQSKAMAAALEKKYGKGSVALSNVTTAKEFKQDWQDMGGTDIKEVNLNYHGSSQTLNLDNGGNQYITSTGSGKTPKGTKATNVQNLPNPVGNIQNAQLNINSCKSNSTTQYTLKGSGLTLAQAFSVYSRFSVVRGTSSSVSYRWIGDREPYPRFGSPFGKWDYLTKPNAVLKQGR